MSMSIYRAHLLSCDYTIPISFIFLTAQLTMLVVNIIYVWVRGTGFSCRISHVNYTNIHTQSDEGSRIE